MALGRKATRNFSRVVSASRADVTIHESSHHVPVGVSTPVKPRSSAARAIWARYSMRGGRLCPSGPNGMTVRLSPDGGQEPVDDDAGAHAGTLDLSFSSGPIGPESKDRTGGRRVDHSAAISS